MGELSSSRGAAGREGEPNALGLEGLALHVFLGVVGSSTFVIVLLATALGLFWTLLLMALVWTGAYLFARRLLNRRPERYLSDWMENLRLNDGVGPDRIHQKAGGEHEAPDGFIREGLIFLRPPGGGVTEVARVYELEPFDLLFESHDRVNESTSTYSRFLRELPTGVTLKWTFATSAEDPAMVRQFGDLASAATGERSRRIRTELAGGFLAAIERGQARRHRILLTLSFPFPAADRFQPGRGTADVERAVADLLLRFEALERGCLGILKSFGTSVRGLPTGELLQFYQRFLNPSLETSNAAVDPFRSLQELWLDAAKRSASSAAWEMDGAYHQTLVMAGFPGNTNALEAAFLTLLPTIQHYRISVNLQRVSSESVLAAARGRHERLIRARQNNSGDPLYDVPIRNEELKISQLTSGLGFPMEVQFFFHVWNPDLQRLKQDVALLRESARRLGEAELEPGSLFSSAKNLWYQSWPGSPFEAYRAYATTRFTQEIAHLLPVLPSFSGAKGPPHALFWGAYHSLARVCFFTGAGESEAPCHVLASGMSGTGKSSFMDLYLSLADPYVRRVVIIDFGKSLLRYAKSHNTVVVVMKAGAGFSINYFQTAPGLVLSDDHLAGGVSLLSAIGGITEPATQGYLARVFFSCYVAAVSLWQDRHPQESAALPRQVLAVHAWWRQRMAAEATFDEAFGDFSKQSPEAQAAWAASFPEQEVDAFAATPDGENLLVRYAVSRFEPGDFPLHSHLVALFEARGTERDQHLASVFEPFTRRGGYGWLFDHPTSIDLTADRIYFELGESHDEKLRTLAVQLVVHSSLSSLAAMAPGERGIFAMDEAIELLKIPSANDLVDRAFRQFRKLRTICFLVAHEYASLTRFTAADSIFANSRLFFLFRQQDEESRQGFVRRLGLPPAAATALKNFPLPSGNPLAPPPTHVDCLMVQPTSDPPVCGLLRVVLPPSFSSPTSTTPP